MEKALNPNTNLETMPTGTYPKADNVAFQNQYGVLCAKRTGEGVTVTVELSDGKVYTGVPLIY